MDNGMTITTEHSTHPDLDFNDEIYRELNRICASLSQQCSTYQPEFRTCLDAAFQALRGGKLIRPRMLLGLYNTLVDDDIEVKLNTVLQVAVALELLHFSLLVHDDVIDGDLYRRGKLNFIGQILMHRTPESFAQIQRDPEHLDWAQSNGLLMGNLFLAATHQIFARLDLPHHQRVRLLDLLNHTINDTIVGEFLDVGLSSKAISPNMDIALEMSRLKTATYTFELPMRAAAILAELPQEIETKIGEIGTNLGIAYQLQDDYLSTFGDAAEHGKDAFSDLREGKETTIIAFARDTAKWTDIQDNFGSADLSTSQAERIQHLLIQCGAKNHSLNAISDHLNICRSMIKTLSSQVDPKAQNLLLKQVEQLASRKS